MWKAIILETRGQSLEISRARRKEAALAAEFGDQWLEYYLHVPAFFSRLRKGHELYPNKPPILESISEDKRR